MSEQKQGSIILKVNDREIPMNPFVEAVFMNVIMGMIASLDKIPQDKERIDIQIRNKQ
jgi:hypothetical protein